MREKRAESSPDGVFLTFAKIAFCVKSSQVVPRFPATITTGFSDSFHSPDLITRTEALVTRPRDYFGSYRLARLIRVGSSCEVWEAVKDEDASRVALKILVKDQRSNMTEVNVLKHEAEIGKHLNHPNIIKIHSFNIENDTPFLVMELFSALNLKLVLRKGIQPIAYMVPGIIEQAAQALYQMHELGFVHCDVKPDNFLVSETGQVKLIDFAISRKLNQGFLASLNPMRWFFRKLQGTRSYMSPEQIRQQSLDARADVYSFGCVLFELVGGKTPFTGDTPDDLLRRHLTAAIPSVQSLNANVTAEFATLIKRMMAKRRDDRPASMWEVLKEFRGTRVFKTIPKPPEKKIIPVQDYEQDPALMRRDNKPTDY